MRIYKIKCRKRWFWKTYTLCFHEIINDKMCMVFPDGSGCELGKWSKYDVILEKDFFDTMKEINEENKKILENQSQEVRK
jgi:hypothetical protein